MFRFAKPEYLYFLALLPLLILVFTMAWRLRRRALERLGNPELLAQLMPRFSTYKPLVKLGLVILALVFLIIGWANPQWGTKTQKVQQRSADVFIALDVSQSMLAQDIAPSRLERSKIFVQNLVEGLRGERIGLIYFAGNAYVQAPLTTDYAWLTNTVRAANPDLIPTQGTAIAEAISLANQSYPDDADNHKALIIVSDGENHESNAQTVADETHDTGLLIFTVAVGSERGAPIPVKVRGREDYKRDATGNPVRTAVNLDMLRGIAQAGGGEAFRLGNNSDILLQSLRLAIDQVEKRELETRIFDEYESYFQYFIGIALVLLIVEFLISLQKNRFLEGKDIFSGSSVTSE